MLTATSLHKKFGPAVALHSLDLTVAPGEIYALLGPNGAGKTTTINCFLGFLTPDAGSASVAGINVALNPLAARRALAYIPEQVNLYGHFSGVENLVGAAGNQDTFIVHGDAAMSGVMDGGAGGFDCHDRIVVRKSGHSR